MIRPDTPHWLAPVEMAKALASPFGQAMLVKWEVAGAICRGDAAIYRRHDCLVAEIWFETPMGPEREPSVLVMLDAPLRENREGRS